MSERTFLTSFDVFNPWILDAFLFSDGSCIRSTRLRGIGLRYNIAGTSNIEVLEGFGNGLEDENGASGSSFFLCELPKMSLTRHRPGLSMSRCIGCAGKFFVGSFEVALASVDVADGGFIDSKVGIILTRSAVQDRVLNRRKLVRPRRLW